MKKLLGFVLLSSLFALGAGAAELTEGTGTVGGQPPGALPATLSPGDEVLGPATVKTADGGELMLLEGARLQMGEPQVEGDISYEAFYLAEGAVRGTLGSRTMLGVPSGWIVAREGESPLLYAKSLVGKRGFVQVREGMALLIYEPPPGGRTYPNFSVLLGPGQAVETWVPKEGDYGFLTDQDNEGTVLLRARVREETEISLTIPKATGGQLTQQQMGKFTEVRSETGSWKDGLISGEVRVDDEVTYTFSSGPGASVIINNETGQPAGYKPVAFQIIERAISLTSEFSTLAVSNFTGLLPPPSD